MLKKGPALDRHYSNNSIRHLQKSQQAALLREK